jgi:putative nucleotidyltransferase with HDIG domain
VNKTSVKQLLKQQKIRIPTLPTILTRISTLLQDPEAGVTDFGQVIDTDPPLAARVLKTANSAFYGHAESVRSTDQAVMTIGTRVLRVLVLQASLLGHYENLSGSDDLDPTTLWKHSILTGQLAQYLAGLIEVPAGVTAESSYTAGLLHDIGKIILLDGLGADYLGVVHVARTMNLPTHQAETQHLGFDHAYLGGIVARRWGLPSQTVEAIESHHELQRRPRGHLLTPMLTVVDVAANCIQKGDTEGARAVLANPTNGLPQLDSSVILDVVSMGASSWPTIEL